MKHLFFFASLVFLMGGWISCKKNNSDRDKPSPAKSGDAGSATVRMIPPGDKDRVLVPSNNDQSPAIPADLEELVELLGQPTRIPMRQIFDSIKSYGNQALSRLLKALSDANHMVRLNTVKVLGEMKEFASDIAPHLIALLEKEPIVQVRSMTIDAMARLELFTEEARAAYLKAMSDEGWLVRWEAVRAAGKFGQKATSFVPHLEKKLQDQSNWVQLYAAIALIRIQGSSEIASKHLATLTGDSDLRFRLNLVGQIDELPVASCPQATDALLKLLVDPAPKVRRATALAMVRCAPELPRTARIEEVLKKAGEDQDYSVRTHAAKALELLKPATP